MPEINHDGPKSESIIGTHLGIEPHVERANVVYYIDFAETAVWPVGYADWIAPPKPTLHERWSERINWWLSDRVRQLRFVVFDISDWLKNKAHALGELEDRLLGL